MTPQQRDYMVEVCNLCLRASCWHGYDLCDEAQGAGTDYRRASELRMLNREHARHYSPERIEEVTGSPPHWMEETP